MNTLRQTLAAAALALMPALAGAHEGGADQRTPVMLETAERNFVLAEMRDFLVATQRIIDAALAGNMPEVAAAAQAVGLAGHRKDLQDPTSTLAGIAKKMPPEFRKMGFATHSAFDGIAQHAREFGDQFGERDIVLKQLSETLGRCTACHGAYRFPEAH